MLMPPTDRPFGRSFVGLDPMGTGWGLCPERMRGVAFDFAQAERRLGQGSIATSALRSH